MGTISSIGNILLPSGSTTVDVQSLLSAAMATADEPLTQLQSEQTTIQGQASALQSIETDMNSLSSAVTALTDTSGAVNSFTTTSSDSNVVSASASPSATAGTHSIVVNSLATTSSYYTDPVATSSTALTTGSFQIAVGSNAPVTITVDDTNNTLDGLAQSINSQNLGVTASVVTDANGARLALVSNTSGTTGNIAISNNTTSLTFNSAVTGANASLTVDGVPISSASNTISSVIPGVTLNLNGAAPDTTVNLTVTPNDSQATTAIGQFVTAWNQVMGDLNDQFSVASNGTGGGALENDSTIRDAQQQLLSAITSSVTGNNGLVNLASIGLNLNDDGTMTVDSSTLSSALSTNFSSVQTLLQGTSGVATALSSALTLITDPSQGSLALDAQGMSQENQDLSTQITAMQAQLAEQQQTLTSQYVQMEATLQELPGLQSSISQQLSSLKTS